MIDFDCDAYGPGTRAQLGLGCFAAPALVECGEVATCRARMTRARQRTFRIIQQQAAAGDPLAVHLAGLFPSPDYLLNGPRSNEVPG